MRHALAIPVFLLLCVCCHAQIEGPDTVGVYQLVKVKSAEVGDSYSWVVFSRDGIADVAPVGDGREAVFVGPPGQYQVILFRAAVTDGKLQVLQAQKLVTISGDGPAPPPGPDPQPTPLPDGTYKLAQFSYDAAQQVTAKQYAPQLAGTFESVAAQMAAGTIRTIADANTKIKNDNAAILGADREKWLPWLNAINSKMTELWGQSANIQTIPGMAGAFREIATGLRAVK